jgi:hypothetical protein
MKKLVIVFMLSIIPACMMAQWIRQSDLWITSVGLLNSQRDTCFGRTHNNNIWYRSNGYYGTNIFHAATTFNGVNTFTGASSFVNVNVHGSLSLYNAATGLVSDSVIVIDGGLLKKVLRSSIVNDSGYVKTTGTHSIWGTKTFYTPPIIKNLSSVKDTSKHVAVFDGSGNMYKEPMSYVSNATNLWQTVTSHIQTYLRPLNPFYGIFTDGFYDTGSTIINNLYLPSLTTGTSSDSILVSENGIVKKISKVPQDTTHYVKKYGGNIVYNTQNYKGKIIIVNNGLYAPSLSNGISSDSVLVLEKGVLKKILTTPSTQYWNVSNNNLYPLGTYPLDCNYGYDFSGGGNIAGNVIFSGGTSTFKGGVVIDGTLYMPTVSNGTAIDSVVVLEHGFIKKVATTTLSLNYLPLSGGIMTGNAIFSQFSSHYPKGMILDNNGATDTAHLKNIALSYLSLAGGTMTGNITNSSKASGYNKGAIWNQSGVLDTAHLTNISNYFLNNGVITNTKLYIGALNKGKYNILSTDYLVLDSSLTVTRAGAIPDTIYLPLTPNNGETHIIASIGNSLGLCVGSTVIMANGKTITQGGAYSNTYITIGTGNTRKFIYISATKYWLAFNVEE